MQRLSNLSHGDRINNGPVLLYFENRPLIRLRGSFEQWSPKGFLFLQTQCCCLLPPFPLQDHSCTLFPIRPKSFLNPCICLNASNASRVGLAFPVYLNTVCLGGLGSFTTWCSEFVTVLSCTFSDPSGRFCEAIY